MRFDPCLDAAFRRNAPYSRRPRVTEPRATRPDVGLTVAGNGLAVPVGENLGFRFCDVGGHVTIGVGCRQRDDCFSR